MLACFYTDHERKMATMWPDTDIIYIAPHLDDVVLSCGGTIWMQARAGQSVGIVTIFAGSPRRDEPLSPFAQSLHERWQQSAPVGTDFSDPPAVRRAEDMLAFKAIDPRITVIHAGLTDCIYRKAGDSWLYASENAIFGQVHSDDPALAALADVSHPEEATVVAPLGVGNHVDHQIIHQWVMGWKMPHNRCVYYEEYPYVADEEAFNPAHYRQDGWKPTVTALSEAALNAKISGVIRHKSQISTFWQDVTAMEKALRLHAARTGGERTWKRGRLRG